jgi:hypothetical protein
VSIGQALLVVFLAELAGAVTGAVLTLVWVSRRNSSRHASSGFGPERRIREAAREWAERHGRPDLAGAIADKLHVAAKFEQRRFGRWPE